MEKQKLYMAKFDWTGEGILMHEEVLKKSIEGIFVVYYNEYADEANKHIDEWNKEANTLGLKVDSSWDCEYMKFMWQKHYEMLMDMTTSNPLFKLMMLKSDNLMQYEFWLGEEFELHLKLISECIGWIDVTFHVEEEKA